ncbi:MAG: GNAT family N-acetyltransferase [Oscillospiraceae bacterium]|nr:GNAT family N-acetyltransferase [Oscillospiraceae bacterium]
MSINTILLSDFTDPRFRAAFQTYFAELDITVRDWDGLFREMDGENKNRAYLMLDGSGGTVGFLQFQLTAFSNWFFEEPFGFVREFWVAPGYRRQGHGGALLRMAEDYFKAHGADRSVLTADDAVGFYLANGYEKSPSIHAKNKMEVFVKTLR